MPQTITPLRYPGGKTSLSQFLSSVLQANDLVNGVYAEPYAGGAGAALNLLKQGIINRVRINDADIRVFSFWQAVLHKTSDFIKLISTTPLCIEEWTHQKSIIKNHMQYSSFDVGFAFFYLNRCNRSGILGANPIGGMNQAGKWKVDARFNKKTLIQKIQAIAEMANAIEISCLDALVFLDNLEQHQERCFVFLDPPYFAKGKSLYLNYYEHEDHVALSTRLKALNLPWVMTYDAAEDIRAMYPWCDVREFTLRHSAQTAKAGRELLIHPWHIHIPQDPKPYYAPFSHSRRSPRSTSKQAAQ